MEESAAINAVAATLEDLMAREREHFEARFQQLAEEISQRSGAERPAQGRSPEPHRGLGSQNQEQVGGTHGLAGQLRIRLAGHQERKLGRLLVTSDLRQQRERMLREARQLQYSPTDDAFNRPSSEFLQEGAGGRIEAEAKILLQMIETLRLSTSRLANALPSDGQGNMSISDRPEDHLAAWEPLILMGVWASQRMKAIAAAQECSDSVNWEVVQTTSEMIDLEYKELRKEVKRRTKAEHAKKKRKDKKRQQNYTDVAVDIKDEFEEGTTAS